MADQLPETTHFGFTQVGSGETLAKNGYSFGTLDPIKLDRLLFAALTHKHTGQAAVGDPTGEPGLFVNPSGGHLPASTTYYYRVSYVDDHGLESAASPEGWTTTGDPIAPGSAPGAIPNQSGGTLAPGVYAYCYTYLDAYGGETTPSGLNNVAVNQDTASGGSGNSFSVDLSFGGALPTDAVSINVYRSRPGQSGFYFIGNTATTTLSDTGLVEDQTISAPTTNDTNGNNSVDITAPLGFFPPGVTAWRIYRTTSSGSYDGNSLVKEVTEGATLTTTTLTTVYTDEGDVLEPGFPLNTSSTVPGGSVVTLNELAGRMPLNTTPRGAQQLSLFVPGAVADNTKALVTETPDGLTPVRFTAFFKTDPSESGAHVQFVLSDTSSNTVTLDCGGGYRVSGDPTGYYHVEFPLVTAGQFEAEANAPASLTGTAFIDNDPTANNTQAVQLLAGSDAVDVAVGALDPGTYNFYARVRVVTYDASGVTDDLSMQLIDTRSDTVLASANYTFPDTSKVLYSEIAHSEMQTVSITGTPTDGTFTLTLGTHTTAPIAYNASASAIQSALAALSNIGTGNVIVTGSAADYFSVTFLGVLTGTNVEVLTATSSITGGGVSVDNDSPTLSYTTTGGVPLAVRLVKNTTSTQVYDIDFARFAATTTTLTAGLLTVTTMVPGATSAADANVVIWF